jgi:T5SS/PEP-CTERM-associated repeat protein
MKWNQGVHASAAILALFSGMIIFGPNAEAAVTSSWNTNSSGLFTVASNWNNGVPGSADTTAFNRGSAITYTVTFPGSAIAQPPPVYTNDRLLVRSNSVSFVRGTGVNGPSYVVTNMGAGATDPGIVVGQLNLDSARLTTAIPVTSPRVSIGRDSGSTGRIDVTAHTTLSISDRAEIGFNGNGTVSIDTGGHVILPPTTGVVHVGSQPGSNGTLNVDGTDSSISGLTLQVGPSGSGSVSISNGAHADFTFAELTGYSNGSSAGVTVDGAGSMLTGSSSITLADSSTPGDIDPATLTVINGGTVATQSELHVGPQGTLRGDGIVAATRIRNEGVIAPGDALFFVPGTLHVTGGVTQLGGGRMQIQLGGTDRATQFDSVQATGAVHLGGEMDITLFAGFIPTAGNSFDVLDGSTMDGAFSILNLPTLPAGLMWNASQLTKTGVLSVQIVGDYNGDGTVNAADYVLWRKTLAHSGSGLPADGNGNNLVDNGDYNVWRAHFGQLAGSGTGAVANADVPEPATWVLCAVGLVLVVGGNRLAMRAVACSVVGVLFASALASSTWAADDTWKTAASGNWETGSSWTDGSTPGNADTATMGQNGTYTATFGATPTAIQQLSVNNGANVTLQTGGGGLVQTLSVNASGGSQIVNLSGSGTTLTLGTSNHTFNLTAGNSLSVQSGSKLQVQFGSDVAATDLSSSGLEGTVIVDGSGSTLALSNSSAINSVGSGGGTGTLTFQNSSTGNSISGALGIADDAVANSNGAMNIRGGSAVSLSGNLSLATQNITGQSASLVISGTGSSLTQSGASSITIGSATNGGAILQIGIPTSGGTLTTGTGTLTINKTGSLYVGDFTGMFTGTLNANGNFTVNGGQFVAGTGFNWATGKTMSIENGSNVTFGAPYTTAANATYNISDANSSLTMSTSSFTLGNGANVNVSAGGRIGATGFNIGVGTAGTLSVDGTDSSASGTGGTMTWGSNGAAATITFSNGAAGNFHKTTGSTSTSLAGSATAGTTAHLTVESGATFATNALFVASAGGATTSATIDVIGFGSTVTVDSMVVGNATTDTAAVNVLNGGTLTVSGPSGNGSATLNHTGTITINGGRFNTGGLTNNGGTLTFTSGTLGITGTNGLTIGSSGPLGNDVTISSGQTVNVTNATTINGGANLTLNAGSLNSGSVILNSTSTLGIGLGGTARRIQYGELTATGHLELAGSLVVSLNSFTPLGGQSFDILDWGSLNGTFSSLQLPALAGGLAWNTSQLYTTGMLSVGLPGDFNSSSVVEASDYIVWRKGLGTTYSQSDYDVWRGHFGQTAGSARGTLTDMPDTTVPEPAAWLVTLLGVVALAVARKAKKSNRACSTYPLRSPVYPRRRSIVFGRSTQWQSD